MLDRDVLMTFEQPAELDPDKHPGELEHGRWKPVTRGTWRHGEIVANVIVILRAWMKVTPGYRLATADPGVKVSRNPDVLRGPDVAVVKAERTPTGKGEQGWLEGAPELAVEVVGDCRTMTEMTAEALEYLKSGALMVWIVEEPRVVVFTPPDHVRLLGGDETLGGGEALPGFACLVAELFD